LYDGNKFTPAAIAISDYHNKWNPRNSISIGASFDARDFYFNPSKGWFLSQSLTWYGLMPKGKFIFPENFGESEFILRSTTIGEKYFQLLNAPVTDNYNLQVVLMGSSTLTMQRPYFGSGISKNSQLYLDGVLNTRGWEIYDDNAGRGNLTWTNSLELRIPVWPNAVALDFIFDASMIKDDMKDFHKMSNMDDWYFSWGPGLRLLMQQLPLRLFFVSNFKMENGSVAWKDRDGDSLKSMMSSWHFVLSFNSPNR
jgi:outer membrane protein insertion porin family